MTVIAVILLLCAAVGAWRILHGPTGAERTLGIQMVSIVTVALLAFLADWQSQPALRDVALVLALLAAIVTAALVQRLRGTGDE